MNKYELMTLTKGSAGEDKAKELSGKVHSAISSADGKVLENDFWGKRKLAYQIKREIDGFYEVINFELDSSKVDELKTKLNLMDNLVRYLITVRKG